MRKAILTDVTSYISAQEYLLSEGMGRHSADPFASRVFTELIQDIFLYDHIYVPHPQLLQGCSKEDFGKEPGLLIELLDRGIVEPLNLSPSVSSRVEEDEENLLSFLQKNGADELESYLSTTKRDEQMRIQKHRSSEGVMLSDLRKWSKYQHDKIRYTEGHHRARISTQNGIELDPIGNFARSFNLDTLKKSAYLLGEQLDYLVATLLRAFRYRIRANIAEIPYHTHIIRRDFILASSFHDSGISEDFTWEVIERIKGIHETIATHAEKKTPDRAKFFKIKVPLVGGNLWREKDISRYANSPDSWIDFVVDSIDKYRKETKFLREAIRVIRNESGCSKFERELEKIQKNLLEVFGLERPELSEITKGFCDSKATLIGPLIEGILIVVKPRVSSISFSRSKWQQFVYRNFKRGWKATK